MNRLVIEGVDVYEIDEDCIRKKEQESQTETTRTDKRKLHDQS